MVLVELSRAESSSHAHWRSIKLLATNDKMHVRVHIYTYILAYIVTQIHIPMRYLLTTSAEAFSVRYS